MTYEHVSVRQPDDPVIHIMEIHHSTHGRGTVMMCQASLKRAGPGSTVDYDATPTCLECITRVARTYRI